MEPTSSPRVGWATTSRRSGRLSSRASTTFCWLPPESVLAGAWTPEVRTSNSSTRCARVLRDRRAVERQAPAEGRAVVEVEDEVLGDREGADQAVVHAVLGHVADAAGQDVVHRRRSSRPAVDGDPAPAAAAPGPTSASVSSVWPLPCTPAMREDLAAAHLEARRRRRATVPASSMTVTSSTSRIGSPGRAGSLSISSCTDRPTISEASSGIGVVRRTSVPTTLPRRRTVIVSATAWTSLSLCVMKTMEVPPARSARTISSSSSISCGVRTAVGSSRMSTLASRVSALMISTRCWTPTGEVGDERVRGHLEAVLLGDRADLLAGLAVVDEAGGHVLVAEHDVLGDGEDGDEHEVLVHHADAGGDGVTGPGERDGLVVDEDLALVGLVEPVEHVHQRALAGAVLAEQAVDLPRLDDEVDVVVGHEGPEALGDAAQFQLHVRTSCRARGPGPGQRTHQGRSRNAGDEAAPDARRAGATPFRAAPARRGKPRISSRAGSSRRS